MQKVKISAKQKTVTVREERRPAAPEVIEFFTYSNRLAPGSVLRGVFQEAPGQARRIPFSNAEIRIVPGQSPAVQVPSEFVLGRPQTGSDVPTNMESDRLVIRNLTRRSHRVAARDGVPFGGVGAPLIPSLGTMAGAIFADGEASGNVISIGPYGNVELFAFRGRWIITGGRHMKLG
jgi:hypothetical protein